MLGNLLLPKVASVGVFMKSWQVQSPHSTASINLSYRTWCSAAEFKPILSLPCFRTFNPADYAEPAQTEDGYGGGSTWNNTGSAELEEATSE